VRSNANPARLLLAVSIAATLAVFLLYTSLAGGATPTLQPSGLAETTGVADLAGVVVGPVTGVAGGCGLRFALLDDSGPGRVAVLYRGSIPDLFRAGRHVMLRGSLEHGTFVAKRDSLVTKCPSRYVPDRRG
jgi:cytochrome c-type biogenesis protein CcmE